MAAAETETAIWQALKARVESIPLAFPVAYPASTYSPTPGTDFLAVSLMSDAPERVQIRAGAHRRRGIIGVTAVQALGQDFAFYVQTGATIAKHFAEDTLLSYNGACVRISSRPQVVDGYREDGWWRTPVYINWESQG